MTPAKTPVLHLLAGPNGAGKSTLGIRVLQPQTHLRFINADAIAARQWPDDQAAHAYDAAQIAEAERRRLIAAGEPFISETVFSHPSKVALIDIARAHGYLVYLHVVMVPLAVALGRVDHRVRHGGHTVPEQKIRERYDRLWPLIAQARHRADTTRFYDNENDVRPLRLVAVYRRGRPQGAPQWPEWSPAALTT